MAFSCKGGTPVTVDMTGRKGGFSQDLTLRCMSDVQRQEFWASLALRYSSGIGPRTWKLLLTHYGSSYAAVMDALGWAQAGVPASRATFCMQGGWRDHAREEWNAAMQAGYNILLWSDPRYPPQLKDIPDPPLFLYYLGDISLFASGMLGVVGARRCSRYGLEVTASISRGLSAKGITVVSGLARGIDRQAHLAALEEVGSTVAVLGSGPDQVYPPENEDVLKLLAERGLVVTEFAPGVPPEGKNFPIRNRIISGLSLGVLVVEAATRSGSLITARLALEQGREVFAIPGQVMARTSSGCHELIKQGAHTVCGVKDILVELLPALQRCTIPVPDHIACVCDTTRNMVEKKVVATCKTGLAASDARLPVETDEEKVLTLLADAKKVHLDTLCRALQWDAGRVSTVLLYLELKGAVRKSPGMLYSVLHV